MIIVEEASNVPDHAWSSSDAGKRDFNITDLPARLVVEHPHFHHAPIIPVLVLPAQAAANEFITSYQAGIEAPSCVAGYLLYNGLVMELWRTDDKWQYYILDGSVETLTEDPDVARKTMEALLQIYL